MPNISDGWNKIKTTKCFLSIATKIAYNLGERYFNRIIETDAGLKKAEEWMGAKKFDRKERK